MKFTCTHFLVYSIKEQIIHIRTFTPFIVTCEEIVWIGLQGNVDNLTILCCFQNTYSSLSLDAIQNTGTVAWRHDVSKFLMGFSVDKKYTKLRYTHGRAPHLFKFSYRSLNLRAALLPCSFSVKICLPLTPSWSCELSVYQDRSWVGLWLRLIPVNIKTEMVC